MNTAIFREYDIRGIAHTDLNDNVAFNIGRAFGTFLGRKSQKSLCVGHDLRESSPRISRAFIDGLRTTGMEIIFIGQVTTPILYFASMHFQADAGAMITGSHNPVEYNGIKLRLGLGAVHGQDIQLLKKMIQDKDFIRNAPTEVQEKEILPTYIDMLKNKFNFQKSLKIIVDAGNATAGPIAPQLWRDLGHEVVELFCEPDGTFPNHLPDPSVPEYMVDLQQAVLAEKADVGVAYDGDSDRVGIVDNRGRMVFADTLLAIFAADVLQRKPETTVIYDVKCSMALQEEIAKHGGVPLVWKTGLLKSKMDLEPCFFAGELSGHIFFKDDFYGFDDGIYSSGRLLEIVAASDKKLSDIVDDIPDYPSTKEYRIDCPDDEKFEIINELCTEFESEYSVLTIDGVRVDFGDGWGLVRASNTQPMLALRFEAKSDEKLKEIFNLFRHKMKKYSIQFPTRIQ